MSIINPDIKLYGFGFNKITERHDYVKYVRELEKSKGKTVVELVYDYKIKKFCIIISNNILYESYKIHNSLNVDELEAFISKMKIMQDVYYPA